MRDIIMITLPIISFCVFSITLVQCADNNNNVDGSATTLTRDFNNDGLGPYNFLFETSNGIKQSEQSSAIATKNSEELLIEVVGSYSYPGTDGKLYEVKYVANATGFYPTGDHIKVPAVVPWPSATSLDDNDANLAGSDTGNRGIIQDSDQGKMSILINSTTSGVSLESSNEFSIQNINNAGQINSSATASQTTSDVDVQKTYIPPPDPTYLPPHTTYLPPHTTYLPPHFSNNKFSNTDSPKSINQLLYTADQPKNHININQHLILPPSQISENQKREAKYDMLNPDSKMNQFAKPSNIIYFILKPQGFSMPR